MWGFRGGNILRRVRGCVPRAAEVTARLVQAVGRAMPPSGCKPSGNIVYRSLFLPGVDAEHSLAVSDKHEGWREWEKFSSVRSHDQRIEDALPGK